MPFTSAPFTLRSINEMCDVKIGRLGKFDFNPRGELWRKDESRFGHKLLSKFGWSQGKGLGKNEDGIAENLKVKVKLGNTGVGWNEKLPIGVDYREYDAVLQDLSKRYQKSGESKNEDISLEKRSQQFKNRMHYQKFIRGKDISRYSDKDMSCIFLSREPEEETEYLPKENTVTNTDNAVNESNPTYNSQMSISDYFAMKMKNKTGLSVNKTHSCEEASPSKTDAKGKKRNKAKELDAEEVEEEAAECFPEENFIFNGQFQDADDAESVKKNKSSVKKTKKFLNIFKSKQDFSNHGQEKSDAIGKSSMSHKYSNLSEETENKEENESTSRKRKKIHQKDLKKAKKLRKEESNISSNVEKSSSHSDSDDTEDNSSEEKIDALRKNSVESESSTLGQSLKYSNSSEESENREENESTSRKRKKNHQKDLRKAKKLCKREADISSSVENSSHSDSDDAEDDTSESRKPEKQPRKESKLKNKIKTLKSCLSNNKYSFKEKLNVSFCENISYKIIENRFDILDCEITLETNEQLLSCSDEECADGEVSNDAESTEINPVEHSNISDEFQVADEQFGDKLEHDNVPCPEEMGMVGEESGTVDEETSMVDEEMGTVDEETSTIDEELSAVDEETDTVKDNTVPECFKLPKNNRTNYYNSWLESQRIAARMKVYKNMAKKMKKHPVLRKTNLLEIKGYGNWGF